MSGLGCWRNDAQTVPEVYAGVAGQCVSEARRQQGRAPDLVSRLLSGLAACGQAEMETDAGAGGVSYRRRAGGGKRDTAEKPILDALQARGIEFWQIGGTGNPDVLIRFGGRLYAGEVKSKGGSETKNQGDFPIWRTPEQVLKAIGAR